MQYTAPPACTSQFCRQGCHCSGPGQQCSAQVSIQPKAVTTGWFVLVAPPHLGQASWAAEPKKILKLCKSLRKRRHSTSTASGNDWALKNSVVKHITWPGACISLKLNPDCEHLSARLGLAALCTLYLPLLQGVDGRRCLLSHRAALRRSKAL